jgi:hypothetical protein
MARFGIAALTEAEGLALLDAALAAALTSAVPCRLDRRAAQRRPEEPPPVLRAAVGSPARRPAAAQTSAELTRRLAELPDAERQAVLLDLVRTQVAGVLGHPDLDAVPPERAFQELGFDSLAGLELRKRLAAATGLTLPATLVFDHPNAVAVTDYLADALIVAPVDPVAGVLAEVARLDATLGGLLTERAEPSERADREAASRPALTDEQQAAVTARLEALLRHWRDAHRSSRPDQSAADPEPMVEQADDDELFAVLDRELGDRGAAAR